MFGLIARLREKSIPQRRRIAFMTAFTITGLIALMWIVWLTQGGLASRFPNASSTEAQSTPAKELWGPLQALGSSLFQGLQNLKKL